MNIFEIPIRIFAYSLFNFFEFKIISGRLESIVNLKDMSENEDLSKNDS